MIISLGIALLLPSALGEGIGSSPSEPSVLSSRTGLQESYSLNEKPPKYKPGFQNFSYVDPKVKKGGVFRQAIDHWNFNTFVPCLFDAVQAPGSQYLYDSLMKTASDDPYTLYPRLARGIEVGPECKWVTFALDERARFNSSTETGCTAGESPGTDNRPQVTSDDVAFSIESAKQYCWQGKKGDLDVVKGIDTKDSKTRITIRLQTEDCRSSIETLSRLPIFSRADFKGKKFDEKSLNQRPMGSGPYQITRAGESLFTYQRVCNYWGQDLPSMRGMANFDKLEFRPFKNWETMVFAFQRGDVDYLRRIPANKWPFDGPAYELFNPYPKLKQEIGNKSVATHDVKFWGTEPVFGIAMNTDRPAFQDRRVRQAFNELFERDFVAQKLKAGNVQTVRTYFPDVDVSLASDDKVLKLLNDLKSKYPKQFPESALDLTKKVEPPADNSFDPHVQARSDGSKATQLMNAAGWSLDRETLHWMKETGEIGPDGKPIKIKFPELNFPADLSSDNSAYVGRLRAFGFEVDHHTLPPDAFQKDLQKGNFDLMNRRFYHADFPNDDIKRLWSPESANDPTNSYNFSRIKSPVLGDLADRLLKAKSEEERQIVTRAFDRVLQEEAPMVLTMQDKRVRMIIRTTRLGHKFELPKEGESPLFNPTEEAWYSSELNP